jgi:hypothetical protein
MTMEVYKSESREIIRRFLARRLTFPQCVTALDAALAGVPILTGDELAQLRVVVLANNETVMKEMERLGVRRKVSDTPDCLPRGPALE